MTVRLKVCLNAVSAVLALAVPAVEEVGLALVQAVRVRSCGAPSLQRSAAKLDLSCHHLMRSCQQPGRNCLSRRRGYVSQEAFALFSFLFGLQRRHSPTARDEVKKSGESTHHSHEHRENRDFASREGKHEDCEHPDRASDHPSCDHV